MNILFFLTPKNEVAYVFEDETINEVLEKMVQRKFSCIPVLSRDGKYVGTISEGDILGAVIRSSFTDLADTFRIPILSVPRRTVFKPVHVHSDIEDLMDRAINQNFVPVTDDQDAFIGIITRKAILKYMSQKLQGLKEQELQEK